jgi:FimV-like protein
MHLIGSLASRICQISVCLLVCACLALSAWAEESVYGPVTKSETLKSIAKHIIGKRELDLRETMADIYYANPEAFVSGRSNILLSNVVLKIPEHLQWNANTRDTRTPAASGSIDNDEKSVPSIPVEPQQSKARLTSNSAAEGPVRNGVATDSPTLQTGTNENLVMQLQRMNRELVAMKKALAASQQQQEMDKRLQGAFYIILLTLLIFTSMPVVVRMIRQRAWRPGLQPAPSITALNEPGPVQPREVPTSLNDMPGKVMPGAHVNIADAASTSLEDITPVRPLKPYLDNENERRNNERPAVEETIHELSDRFKDLLQDKDASNLALARIYLDLGDYEQAKPLLAGVHRSTTPDYVQQADDLIQELLQAQIFAASFNMIVDDLTDDSSSTLSHRLEKLSLNRDTLDTLSDTFMSQQRESHEDAQYEYDVAQRFFDNGNYQQSKQHLARILGFRGPHLKSEAYDLLKQIEKHEPVDDDQTMKSTALPDDDGSKQVKKIIRHPARNYTREQLGELSGQFMALANDAAGARLALANLHYEMGEPELALALCRKVTLQDEPKYASAAEELMERIQRAGNT